MTKLEKEFHREYQTMTRSGRRVDDAMKAAFEVSRKHIKALIYALQNNATSDTADKAITLIEDLIADEEPHDKPTDSSDL